MEIVDHDVISRGKVLGVKMKHLRRVYAAAPVSSWSGTFLLVINDKMFQPTVIPGCPSRPGSPYKTQHTHYVLLHVSMQLSEL